MLSYHLVVRRKGIGDTIAITPLVRDLATQYPDIRLSVEGTHAAEIFAHDSRVLTSPDEHAERVVIDYKDALDRSRTDRASRYLNAAHEEFFAETSLAVANTSLRPSLVLSAEESIPPDESPYIVIAAGAKWDMPVKNYGHAHWCEVVRLGRERGWRFKQVGLEKDAHRPHIQTPIPGAENHLGQTPLRRLFRMIRHARGVLCHVSLPLLIASAFETPCVVIGGGREDPWYFEGSGVSYLDTIGRLPCCQTHGCRTCFPIAQHSFGYPPGTLCSDPTPVNGEWLGRCMTLIEPQQVIEAFEAIVPSYR